MTLEELRAAMRALVEKRKAKLDEALAAVGKAKTEQRALSDDEKKTIEAREAEVTAIDAEIEQHAKWIESAERQAELEDDAGLPARSLPKPQPRANGGAPAIHTREVRPYSLFEAVRAMINPSYAGAEVERRASAELAEQMGRQPGETREERNERGLPGLYVPFRALLPRDVEQRVLAKVTPNTTGASLIQTDVLFDELIEVFRNESRVVAAGARMLPGMIGDVSVPRQNGAATAAFVANEDTAVAESTQTYNGLALSPKTVGLKATLTRRMLKQPGLALEGLTREEIRQAVALAIDNAALNGSGAGGNPTGVIATAGIGGVTTAGAITWTHVQEFESDLGVANALKGKLAYMMPYGVRGILKRKERATNTGLFLMDPDGSMNGYASLPTQQVPANNLVFGNWAEILIPMWDALDMFADPYSAGDKGHVILRGFQDIDIGVRHAASFTLATDVTG